MARNLSERLLDMVEDDPCFIDLEPATIIVWLKMVRLFHRASSRRGGESGLSYRFEDIARFLRVTDEEHSAQLAALVSRGLLVSVEGKVRAPPELNYRAAPRPSRTVAPFVPRLIPAGGR